ncbi:MAG: HNH endonuclease signature motif containing protein [Nocardioides sp.]
MAVDRSRRGRAARRRKVRMGRVEHDLDAGQWSALQEAWGGCAYCGATGKPLQRDCVLALSRGGRYTLDNIVPACGSCNASKCNDEVTGWLRRKRFDERAFLVRHVEVRAALAGGAAASSADLPLSGAWEDAAPAPRVGRRAPSSGSSTTPPAPE